MADAGAVVSGGDGLEIELRYRPSGVRFQSWYTHRPPPPGTGEGQPASAPKTWFAREPRTTLIQMPSARGNVCIIMQISRGRLSEEEQPVRKQGARAF